jgi:predicted secreted hydrolase
VIGRRPLLLALAAAGLARRASGEDGGAADSPRDVGDDVRGRVRGDPVVPRPLQFPADHGAHPRFGSEWWYLTGWLDAATGQQPIGFQLTFFRVRTGIGNDNPSAFAPRQLLVAHAAIADPADGRLRHDQAIARAGFGVVAASEADTDVRLGRWSFRRDAATDRYHGFIPARNFTLEVTATPTGPLLLQGAAGFSPKGPAREQASYYYSRPQLAVTATIERDDRREQRRGIAWLDHEWSSAYLAPGAAGWDWLGMNLDDGSTLTAFIIRARAAAAAPVWAYAALRSPTGKVETFGPDTVRFTPERWWTSPRNGTRWPVAQRIDVGGRSFVTAPLFDDQELDSRASTGAIYWEGASRLLEGGKPVGRGYLELTGYVEPLRL